MNDYTCGDASGLLVVEGQATPGRFNFKLE